MSLFVALVYLYFFRMILVAYALHSLLAHLVHIIATLSVEPLVTESPRSFVI